MVNKVILLGNVGKDPEVKQFENGSICNFTLATSESYKDKSGERVKRTEWHNLSVGAPGLVDVCAKYVKKGDMLYVEGKIRTREYEKDGQKRYATDIRVESIQLMPKAQNNGGGQSGEFTPAQKTESTPTMTNADFVSDNNQIDDDLPF